MKRVAAGSLVLLAAGCASTPAEDCFALPGVVGTHIVLENGGLLPVAGFADTASRVAYLHCRARQGGQGAQLALGLLYEAGTDVPQDWAQAARWYEEAARAVPFTTAVYSPPVRPGGAGQVLMINNPGGRNPSPEALFRLGLMRVEGRGVPVDARAGRRMIERAARMGQAGAAAWLRRHPAPDEE